MTPNNRFGGTSPAARNLISGNPRTAIACSAQGSGTVIQGNFIGTDVTGTLPISNATVRFDPTVSLFAPNIQFGGTASGAGNVVSGNLGVGLTIGSMNVVVQGNRVGTDVTGTKPLGNGQSGIRLEFGRSATIGGTTPAARNIISGNAEHGILIGRTSISTSSDNIIQGNYIGTDITGGLPLGNALNGIEIEAGSSNNLIGGTAPGAGNLICFNGTCCGGAGVRIIYLQSLRNSVLGNAIFANNSIAIDLAGDGVTPNDPADADAGPNGLQNFPVISAVTFSSGATLIHGSLNSTANTTFRVEFFANSSPNLTAFGDGQSYLGSTTVATDGSGNGNFNVTFPVPVDVASAISATATDPQGNTSEFSQCFQSGHLVPLPTAPRIEMLDLPSFGTGGNASGKVYNVNPGAYNVALFIYVPDLGWYTKPTFAQALTPVMADGTWSASVTTGGVDDTATKVAAYLLPAAYAPPFVSSADGIPAEIEQHAVAKIVARRFSAYQRRIRFSGLTWLVKSNRVVVGPGPNNFRESTENVWIDSQGRLHLRITHRNGTWICPEVYTDRTLGYGTYRFYLDTPVDSIDPNAVLGLFSFSDDNSFSHREIDFEASRWQQANNMNAQFVVQPFQTAGNIHRFQLPAGVAASVHSFQWTSDHIQFQSVAGSNPRPANPASIIDQWLFGPLGVPPTNDEKIHANLWLINGQAPTDGQEVEVVIRKFVFIGQNEPYFDIDGNGNQDLMFQNQSSGDLVYWFMNGGRLMNWTFANASPGPTWRVVGTPDLNGDGQPDILFQNRTTGVLAYWLMQGANEFSNGLITPSDPGSVDWQVVGTPDLNGDGQPDILFQNQQTGLLAYWIMNGTRAVSIALLSPSDPGSPDWKIVATGSLFHDGNPDLVFQHQKTGQMVYWHMKGTMLVQWGYITPSSPGSTVWKVVGLTDIDGDGNPDLLFQHQSTGEMVYWLMNGTSLKQWGYLSPSTPGAAEWAITAPH